MSVQVDHKARKQEIIARSIRLFVKDGYKDVTFQKLADYCGLARTALYRYFHDKRQIFDAAIQEAERRIGVQFAQVLNSDASVALRLQRICTILITAIYENREFIGVIVDFVLSVQRIGRDIRRPIAFHSIGIRHTVHKLVAEGVRTGEFKRNVSPRQTTDLIYSIIEAHILRITVTDEADLNNALASISFTIDSLKAPKTVNA